jgi:AraC-like DNA-binding protein
MLDLSISDFIIDGEPLFECPISRYMRNNQTVTAAVVNELNQRLCPEFNTRRKVAQALGVSEKKLQRLLQDEETSFAVVLDAFRQLQTVLMLRRKKLSLKEVAVALGYSSSGSFNHACKRWFGVSPKVKRREILAKHQKDTSKRGSRWRH